MLWYVPLVWSALSVLVLSTTPNPSGNAVFEELSKDFGAVPKGTILTHQFKLTNNLPQPLHVSGLRTSCVCSTASILRHDLQPGESTYVVVQVDTNKYSGHRAFTVFVNFDRPYIMEGRLVVSATSRDDLMMSPTELNFGVIKYGTGPTKSMLIENRSGNSGWVISQVLNENGYLQPKLEEVSREFGLVRYRLTVKLREDTPAGAWHADLWLVTNDAASPRLRVPLLVEVQRSLTVTPTLVAFGNVSSGKSVERKVTLRGAKPFKITAIDGAGSDVEVKGQTDEARVVHILTIKFTSGGESGEWQKRLKIKTDHPEEADLEIKLQAVRLP